MNFQISKRKWVFVAFFLFNLIQLCSVHARLDLVWHTRETNKQTRDNNVIYIPYEPTEWVHESRLYRYIYHPLCIIITFKFHIHVSCV